MKAALDWVIRFFSKRITWSCDSFERLLRLSTARCHQFQVWMMTSGALSPLQLSSHYCWVLNVPQLWPSHFKQMHIVNRGDMC